jgi:hypothetical protein
MTVPEIVPIDGGISGRRSAAAFKAWQTRRAQGWAPAQRTDGPEPRESEVSAALAAFEREAAAASPDWHGAALKLKAALESGRGSPTLITRATAALPAPPWHDYPVDHLSAFKTRNPTIVVTFADGEVVRAPAVSALNRPLNIGRGLRVAIAFYQHRMRRRAGRVHSRAPGWHYPDVFPSVPAITACVCAETGETFDAELCSLKTTESRAEKGGPYGI